MPHPSSNLPFDKPESLDTVALFDATVVRIFAYLYEYFPVAQNIDATEFLPVRLACDGSPCDVWKQAVAEHAMRFLVAEGFVRVGHDDRTDKRVYLDAVLTSKALAKLKMPLVIDEKNGKSIGQQFLEVSRIAGDGLIKASMSALVQMVVK